MIEGRFGVIMACLVASGATALTYLTALGGLYPNAPNDTARFHLLLAAILPFFGFISAVLLAGSAALFDRAKLSWRWVLAPQLVACAVNLAILFSLLNQTAAALGQWFESAPASSQGVDWLIRTGLALGAVFILAGLVALGGRLFERLFKRGK